MASPFYYSNRWNYPRRYYYPTEPSPTPSPPARKVVSIPVHHVASPSPSDLLLRRSDSAARKIQKVFRGFLVRKSMKRIAGIRSEVNAVEIRISGTTDLICRDGKERLKVNETLMSLLFRLDSVPGSDPGVRDFRKRVINKAIALQEFVDSIADSGFENHESLESAAAIDEAEGRGGDSVSDCAVQLEISREQTNDDDQAESQWEDLQNWTLVEEDDSDGCNASEKQWGDHSEKNGDGEKEKRKNTELLEKMAGENERMIGMMAALYERNRMQARLLDALSQRVEQLERAFICDKLRRKKRRSGIGSAADCVPENTKIWKKL